MLNVIIIEDEIPSQETIINLLNEYCVKVNILGVASNVQDGTKLIESTKPDLVFLDIEIHKGTGFDILEAVQDLHFQIVFTTAYEHYALKAIKFSAMDYLLKPIDVIELQEVVQRAHDQKNTKINQGQIQMLLANIKGNPSEKKTIALKLSEGYKFVDINDICYCEADGAYTHIALKSGEKIIQSKSLKEFQNLFDNHDFLRVHHSFLINKNEVDSFVKSKTTYVVMRDGTEISVSARRKDEFLRNMSLK